MKPVATQGLATGAPAARATVTAQGPVLDPKPAIAGGEPLRILHVIAETGYSGGEVQLERLVADLQRRGHDNHVAVPRGAAFADVAAQIGAPVLDMSMHRPWHSCAVGQLRAAVRRLRPDVVHLGCGRSTLWGGMALFGMREPVKVTTRRIDYPVGRAPWRGWRYRKLVDHVVANCKAVRERFLAAGVDPSRVSLVYEGIDVSHWVHAGEERLAARRRLRIPDDAKVVSCAATLRPRKGHKTLIEAFRGVVRRFPDAILILAGSGSDHEALVRHANAAGLADNVWLPGPVRPVRDLYAASDIAVMASYYEGLSNACLEAAASGLPLVVSAVGGLPEIVEDGETGFVVRAGEASAFEDRIIRLLADDEFRAAAGRKGSERVREHFPAERMSLEMEVLFSRLVAERRALRMR